MAISVGTDSADAGPSSTLTMKGNASTRGLPGRSGCDASAVRINRSKWHAHVGSNDPGGGYRLALSDHDGSVAPGRTRQPTPSSRMTTSGSTSLNQLRSR